MGLTVVESWPAETAPTAGDVRQVAAQLDWMLESFTDLEQNLREPGWRELSSSADRELSRAGLADLVRLARIMALKHPLVGRALRVRAHYVHGQGVEISGRAEPVNHVISRFHEDPGNRAELFGHQARVLADLALGTDGNLFLALFANPRTGHVKVRTLPFDEIVEIATDPEDTRTPWFYRRAWAEDAGPGSTPRPREAWYPDWQHRPAGRPGMFAGLPVRWQSPVLHVAVGGLRHMRFGVPTIYPALDWARAVTRYLEDWATIQNSLARFAWRAKGSSTFRQSVEDALSAKDQPAGGVAMFPDGAELAPIPKTSGKADTDGGRQIRLMVGAATDLPDTILSSDADVGNLATARTLDRPTELAMVDRQHLWADIIRSLDSYAIEWAVRAPGGRLRGRIVRDDDWDSDIVELAADPETGEPMDPTVDVVWPPILEHDVAAEIEAVVRAATLDGKSLAGVIPARTVAQRLLAALGVQDVDDLVDEIADVFADQETIESRSFDLARRLVEER